MKEKDRWDLDYLMVRLQHSRDEFPFVVLLFFSSLIRFLSIAFYHVDDDTNIGRDGGLLLWFYDIFSFLLPCEKR